jgi:hypothetical protein
VLCATAARWTAAAAVLRQARHLRQRRIAHLHVIASGHRRWAQQTAFRDELWREYLAIASAGPVAGCQVRAMRTAMSSAGWGASAASRVSHAWLTGRVLVVCRVRARRVMAVSMSAAGLSMRPSVYRTRVLWRAAYDGHLAALQAIVSNKGFHADARRGDGLAELPGPEGTPVNA